MLSRNSLYTPALTLFSLLFVTASPSFADSSHVRIIRLSLVQGDVRFARDVKGDPLASGNATWEAADMNLPIRQGYVLATDKGRAEVEFENGSLAFLSDGTVLEFYDLSLEDGAKTTRLVLRQGTASFYVNPANGDYFSVTGGDFSVEADARSNFRLDNFDDGSVVNVLKGHVSVLRKNQSTALAKGQSLSIRASDSSAVSVGNLTGDDDFDRWVSGQIANVQAATNAAQQYVNSGGYSSGLASLYTYGSFYPCAGYGNCWRPYGVGLGWSPFDSGFWFTDPSIGMSFIGNQPWGWTPYHYGGWICDPAFGWMWAPSGFGNGFYGGNPRWSPVTGIWLHSRTGPIGIVPVHPLDVHGKTPINLANGVFPVSGGALSARVPVATAQEWKVVKSVPRNTLSTNLVAAAPPERVLRTLVGGNLGAHVVTLDHNSSIAYDAREHRFVNTNSAPPSQAVAANSAAHAQNGVFATQRANGVAVAPSSTTAMRVTRGSPPAARTSVPAPRAMTPPPVSRSTEFARGSSSIGGRGSEPSSRSSSSSASSSAAPRASSAPASSGSSSGGRPH
jgi:FecR protein